jgi:endonuclease-8
MPEGDTIFRSARTMHAALAGRTITSFETVLPQLARVD